MKLRRATPADAAALVALEQFFPGDRMSAASVRRFLRVPSAAVWVVEQGGSVCASLILLTRRGSAVARIYSLVVAPSARGQGLGVQLVQTAERAARRAGCHAVSLEVRADNRAARSLYAGLGYREHARLPGYYEDGAAGLRLRKPLRAAVRGDS